MTGSHHGRGIRAAAVTVGALLALLGGVIAGCPAEEAPNPVHDTVVAGFSSAAPEALGANKPKPLQYLDPNDVPLPAADVAADLLVWDRIWCAIWLARDNEPAFNLLRSYMDDADPSNDVNLYYYMSGTVVRYDLPTDLNVLNYTYINTHHPEWFLKADESLPPSISNRISYDMDPNVPEYRWRLDVANPAFRQYAAERFLERVDGSFQGLKFAYDGLAVDNIVVGQGAHSHIDADPRYTGTWRYYGQPDAWAQDHADYIQYVRDYFDNNGGAQYDIIINTTLKYCHDTFDDSTYWPWFLAVADGIMGEQRLSNSATTMYLGSNWEDYMDRREAVMDAGVVDWWMIAESTTHGDFYFRYHYCSFLLNWRDGQTYFWELNPHAVAQHNWYPQYEYDLGQPIMPRMKDTATGLWARGFDHAVVFVNPTATSQAFQLSDPLDPPLYYDPETGLPIHSVTIDSGDAKIVLEL